MKKGTKGVHKPRRQGAPEARRHKWHCAACGKTSFASRAAAKASAERVSPGEPVGEYRCPVGVGYHWGHKAPEVIAGEMRQADLSRVGYRGVKGGQRTAARAADDLTEHVGDAGRVWFDAATAATTVMCGTCVDARLAPVVRECGDPWSARAWWDAHQCGDVQEATG